jgi:hypothetical protein
VPRTLSPAAPTDRRYWRLLLRRAHPDTGGTHDLFLWTQALHEHVAGDHLEEQPPVESTSAPIYPLSVTSVTEHEDGSLEVNSSGQITPLEGEDAHAFKLATQSAYRAQQEQPTVGKRALELWRQGALA